MLVPLLALLACAPPAPAPPPVRVLIGTWTSPPSELPAGEHAESAWSHAPRGRPALAALLTGRLPEANGVRHPQLHTLAVPSIGHRVHDAGMGASAEFLEESPLWDGEDWGFRPHASPRLVWIHGPGDAVVARAEAWLAETPEGHALLTSDGGTIRVDAAPIPLIWAGPESEALTPAPVGHVDAAVTALALLGLTPELDGTDLRSGGSDVVVQEDARATFADDQATVRIERTLSSTTRSAGSQRAPVFDVAPAPWRLHGLPSDPHAAAMLTDPALAARRLQQLTEVATDLGRGHLRRAEEQVQSLTRQKRSVATEWLSAEIDQRKADPIIAVERREQVALERPSAVLSLAVAMDWLDAREPARAAEWFDDVLARWPEHPAASLGRLRCAHLLGEPDVETRHAGLFVIAPDLATLFEAFMDTENGYPVSMDSMEVIERSEGTFATRTHARILWNASDEARAISIAREALRTAPRDTALRLDLATWYLDVAEPDRAARLLAPVERRFPDDLRVSILFEAAKADMAQQRADLEALRASWRKVLVPAGPPQ